MQLQATPKLFARIFGMAKTVLGQSQSRRRHGAHVRIADERQDWMIKGRSGYFDSALLRGRGMCGQHLAQQFTLASDHEGLILQRESLTLFDQSRDIRVVEKELIKPCYLREHLQIGEVL